MRQVGAAKVLRALAKSGLAATDLTPLRGGINMTFVASQEDHAQLFVKVSPRTQRWIKRSGYERLQSAGWPMPRRLLSTEIATGFDLEVFEYIAGDQLSTTWMSITVDQRRAIARRIGQQLYLLHSLNAVRPVVFARELPLSRLTAIHSRTAGLLSASDARRLRAVVEDCIRAGGVVICHGDVSHKNFLIRPNTALCWVDWEWACLCCPEFDFKNIEMWSARGLSELKDALVAYEQISRRPLCVTKLAVGQLYYSALMLNRLRWTRANGEWIAFHRNRGTEALDHLMSISTRPN